jgi:4-amino-4-deoxy-L-arabinose transferase-like glycosyltransferase
MAALLAYAVLAYGYVTLTPPWQNPDEPAHFNYVAFVATTGGLPVLRPGDWDSELLQRLKTGTLQPTDSISQIRYESWQPPLFYLVAAPVYLLGPPDQSLYRLRALGAVFGAITLVLAYAVTRSVLPEPLAAAVPLAITGVPMFTAVSASLSADPLANLLAAAMVLVLVTRLRRQVPPLAIGALLGLGLLTKLELAIFVPVAIAVVATRAKWRETITLLATATIVTLPWLVHQVTSYGWTDAFAIARHSQVVTDQPRFPGFSLDWVQQFATITFHSFWAQFGWMAVVAPDRLYWSWGAIAILAVVGLIIERAWVRDPAVQLLVGTVAIAAVAYVGYNLSFIQFQGRYLFTAIVPIGILLVRGWNAFPPRPWLALVLALGLVALNAYALTRVLSPGFAPPV